MLHIIRPSDGKGSLKQVQDRVMVIARKALKNALDAAAGIHEFPTVAEERLDHVLDSEIAALSMQGQTPVWRWHEWRIDGDFVEGACNVREQIAHKEADRNSIDFSIFRDKVMAPWIEVNGHDLRRPAVESATAMTPEPVQRSRTRSYRCAMESRYAYWAKTVFSS